ncbi:hypothetical protein SRABI106_04543 [Rahnella aquatilis]|nr:hypothetical protein SRABI106_04543 [Rahnella aquatilis]
MRFDFFQQTGFVEGGDHGFTCGKTLKATELLRDIVGACIAFFAVSIEDFSGLADITIESQDIDHRQAVTFTDFIVVKVMRRGDLHATRTFLHIGVFIGNNRNTTAYQRENDLFADQIAVTRIFRVNGNAGITEHGFRTRGGDHQVIFAFSGFRAVSQRITQVPHGTFGFAVFHFKI